MHSKCIFRENGLPWAPRAPRAAAVSPGGGLAWHLLETPGFHPPRAHPSHTRRRPRPPASRGINTTQHLGAGSEPAAGRTAEGRARCPSLRGSDSSVWTRNPGAGLAPHFHRLPPSGFQPRVLQVFTRGRSAPSVPPACSKHRERALQGDSALAGRGVDAAQPPRRPPPARARPSQPGRGSSDSFLCAGALGAERSVAAVFPDPRTWIRCTPRFPQRLPSRRTELR